MLLEVVVAVVVALLLLLLLLCTRVDDDAQPMAVTSNTNGIRTARGGITLNAGSGRNSAKGD